MLLLILSLFAAPLCFAAEETDEEFEQKLRELTTDAEGDELPVDFDDERAFIDIKEALGSKAFVHRAILSTAISDSSEFRLGRGYINHIVGFKAISQPGTVDAPFAKYVAGVQGLAGGYVTTGGHAFESGLELSSVSVFYASYRYFIRPKGLSFWPYIGLGAGLEISSLSISDGPIGAQQYDGTGRNFFGSVGLLIPLVDVGIKVEIKGAMYGSDRRILTQSLGVILFL